MASSEIEVLKEENERLNQQRIALLREMRERAQVLGKRAVLHYGLSADQCQQLNEYASRLRRAGPSGGHGVISPGTGGDARYAGLRKQLRDAMSTAATLRKELRTARQEKMEAQRLLNSGRWGNPGYLRNSFDGISTQELKVGESLVTTSKVGGRAGRYGNQTSIKTAGVRRRRPFGADANEELEVLRVTCSRLKEEIGLPKDFEYDDIGSYSKGEVAEAKARLSEAERQIEVLEAERSAAVATSQEVQLLNVKLQKENGELRDELSQRGGDSLASNSQQNHQQLLQSYHGLRSSLSRAEVELRLLRSRDDRANSILASNKRRENELADCMTELLATRRALEASHAELDREREKNNDDGSDEDERLTQCIQYVFDEIAEDVDSTSRVKAASLINAIVPDADGDSNAEIVSLLNKHWALRVLRLQLTVAGKSNAGEDDYSDSAGSSGGAAGTALLSLGRANRDECLSIDDVKEFCLGPLLSLYFHQGSVSFPPGMGSNGPLGGASRRSTSSEYRDFESTDSKCDDEAKSDGDVVVAVPVVHPAKVKSAWGKEDTGAKLLAAANETIRRQKRRIQKLESQKMGTGAFGATESANPHRMVQLFEKKYADERDRASALRRRCQTLQEDLLSTKKEVTSLSAQLKSKNEELENKTETSSNASNPTGNSDDAVEREDDSNNIAVDRKQSKSKRTLEAKLDAATQEIEYLRETNRRLLRKLGLDESFKFPDMLIKDALRTRMDDMKEANEAIARASRDQLWDARRKIAVLERQLAKETRRSARLAAVAKSAGTTSKDVRLTLALQKRVDAQAATIRKMAVRLQNMQGEGRKKAVELQSMKLAMETKKSRKVLRGQNSSKPEVDGVSHRDALDTRANEDGREEFLNTAVTASPSNRSNAKKTQSNRNELLVQEVGPVSKKEKAHSNSGGRMMTAPGKPRDKAMESMLESLQKENRRLKKRNLRLADSYTLLKLKHEALSSARGVSKDSNSSNTTKEKVKTKKTKKKKKKIASTMENEGVDAEEEIMRGNMKSGSINKPLISSYLDRVSEGSSKRISLTLRKRMAHLEVENKRIVAANKVLQSRAQVTTEMIARVYANAKRKFDSDLASALREGRQSSNKLGNVSHRTDVSQSVNIATFQTQTSGSSKSLISAPMLRRKPERPRSAGSVRSSSGKNKPNRLRRTSNKRSRKTKSKGIKEHDNEISLLVLQSQFHVLQRTKTELEAELTMTRTLCHEMQAQSIERSNKILELETVVRKAFMDMEKDYGIGATAGSKSTEIDAADSSDTVDRDDSINTDSGLKVDQILNEVLDQRIERKKISVHRNAFTGKAIPKSLLLLVQSQRQIEIMYRVLHEKQAEIHSFACNSVDSSGGDSTIRAETEYAVDEFYVEVDRLNRELARVRKQRDSELEKLNHRLKKQIRSAERTREAANHALESVLEVYPEALSLITDSASSRQSTGRMGMSPMSSAPRSKKGSSPMSLILEQGGRIRRAKDTSKHGAIDPVNGIPPSSPSDAAADLSDDVLNWTPSQVGTWLANIIGLPHCVPRFLAEAVDGQLLLTLTDADLAGELGMASKGIVTDSYEQVSPDEHEEERRRVIQGIELLKEKNKAFRKRRKKQKKRKEELKKTGQSKSKPRPNDKYSIVNDGLGSPGHLKHRLSLIDTEEERIEMLVKEITTLQSQNTTIREQHALLSNRLEKEQEQARQMRHSHEEERKAFEKKILAEQNATLELQREQMEQEKLKLEFQQQQKQEEQEDSQAQQKVSKADVEAEKAAAEAAKKAAEERERRKRLKAMFSVNEIPSFHTVRPPKGKVVKHEPRDSKTVNMSTVKGVLK